MQNKSCDEIKTIAKATIENAVSPFPSRKASFLALCGMHLTQDDEQGDGLPAYKNIMGKMPHNWYLVAIDCTTRQCPKIDSVNISFYHPNSDGSSDACSGLPASAQALQEALMEGVKAMSLRNILDVAGLSPFGVFCLYREGPIWFLC